MPLLSGFFFTFYVIALGYWVSQMRRFKSIQIQYYILYVLVVSVLQSFFMLLHYSIMDNQVTGSTSPLTLFIILCDIFRSSMSRGFLLVTALGYHMVIKSIDKYSGKIGIVVLLYAVCLGMSLFVQYSNHSLHILASMETLMSLPVLFFNMTFIFWIGLAFKRTLTYLTRKQNEQKAGLFRTLAYGFLAIVLSVTMVNSETVFSGNDWR